MKMEMVYYGDPRLRAKGEPVRAFDGELRVYVDDLLETMRAYRGVGLASQQVGRALQVAVVDITGIEERPSKMWIGGQPVDPEEHMPLLLINPELELTKKKTLGPEGCLSFPTVYADINRSVRVKCTTRTVDGRTFVFEAAGLLGRAVQHETDHLHGRLFLDLMNAEDRQASAAILEGLKRGEIPQIPETEEAEK
ncbi:MAG: peptide deformylase [Verrucomicrobiota bacterium]